MEEYSAVLVETAAVCHDDTEHGFERDRIARRVLGIDDEPRGGFDYVKRVPKKWPEDLFWNCSDDRRSNAARS